MDLYADCRLATFLFVMSTEKGKIKLGKKQQQRWFNDLTASHVQPYNLWHGTIKYNQHDLKSFVNN